MRKLLIAVVMLLVSNQAFAAPYDMDSPPESYTWGETQQDVHTALFIELGRSDVIIGGTQALYLPPSEGKGVQIYSFWQDQLIGISYLPDFKGNYNDAAALYLSLYNKFTENYGPAQPALCFAWQGNCTALKWQASPVTSIRLNKVELGGRLTTSYYYVSSQLYPHYEQEFQEYGPVIVIDNVMKMALSSDSDQQKIVLGRRIRLSYLQVVSIDPLLLEGNIVGVIGGRYKVACSLQKEVPELSVGNKVIVSGVVDGVNDDHVLSMSEVIIFERLENEGWREDFK